jgi:hypothetical protein
MRKPLTLFSLLLAALLLLAACSGGGVSDTEPGQPNLPAEQDAGNDPALSAPDNQNGEQAGNNENQDGGLEAFTDTGFDPTPSPLFQQSLEPNPVSDRDYSEYEIITLLPPDGIPALDFPDYVNADEADEDYLPDELVIGVEFNGDARAYSVPLLSRHEIVNDTVGGIHLSVTW